VTRFAALSAAIVVATLPIGLAQKDASAQTFGNSDARLIVDTSRNNELRFKLDFKGKTFSDVMRFESAKERTFGSGYLVEFSERNFTGIYCFVDDKAILKRVIDWNKDKMVKVTGIIEAAMFGKIELDNCKIDEAEGAVLAQPRHKPEQPRITSD